jgi:hypothetical protein
VTIAPAQEAHWRHFPHDADIGIEGIGATIEEAFENAAVALTRAITDANVAAERLAIACTARIASSTRWPCAASEPCARKPEPSSCSHHG